MPVKILLFFCLLFSKHVIAQDTLDVSDGITYVVKGATMEIVLKKQKIKCLRSFTNDKKGNFNLVAVEIDSILLLKDTLVYKDHNDLEDKVKLFLIPDDLELNITKLETHYLFCTNSYDSDYLVILKASPVIEKTVFIKDNSYSYMIDLINCRKEPKSIEVK